MSALSGLGAPAGALQGGGLSFGQVPSFGISGYGQAYQNALSLNQQNYANILSGYGQLESQQAQQQGNIQQGYGNLYNTVLGGIQGIGASQLQAIRDAYAQQSGGSAQQLINAGLGNTTVQQSVQRGNMLDRQKAETGLANQIAQLQAGYQSQLGMAGLSYANQANMQNTALKGQQLNWMNSVNAPYPNTAAYAALAQQQGYANMAKQLYGQIPKGVYGAAGGGGQVNLPPGGFGIGGSGSFGGGGGGEAPMQQSQAGWVPPTGAGGGAASPYTDNWEWGPNGGVVYNGTEYDPTTGQPMSSTSPTITLQGDGTPAAGGTYSAGGPTGGPFGAIGGAINQAVQAGLGQPQQQAQPAQTEYYYTSQAATVQGDGAPSTNAASNNYNGGGYGGGAYGGGY